MRLIYTVAIAAIAAVLFVGPAAAQGAMSIPLNGESGKSPEEIEKQRQIEADYKATIKKMPDAKANDPWGNMRSADTGGQAKPAPKPKAPKKTTSSAVN